MLTVQNLARRMATYELPHELAGSDRIKVGAAPRERGVRGLKVTTQRAARVLTLTAAGTDGDRVGGLPDAYRKAPDLAAAEARGELRFVDEKPAEQAAPAAAADNAKLVAPAAEATTQGLKRAHGGEK